MTADTSNLTHEKWCLPRPGEEGPRIEWYTQTAYDQTGVVVVKYVACERCQECGVIAYDGVQPD